MGRGDQAGGGSLSLRLLAFAGGAFAIALVLAWAVLGTLFERHAERQFQAELERYGIALIASASLNAGGTPQLERYPTDPRFERPASGLYWYLAGPGGTLQSRSLWDGALTIPTGSFRANWAFSDSAGPFEPSVIVAVRDIQLENNGPTLRVVVAGDGAPLAAARANFEREAAVFLAVLWSLLALAAWVQVRLGLRPLRVVKDELTAMSAAPDVRLDVAAHPAEIRPLTEAINNVATQRAEDIVRARQRAKDLAHALKTPLTALRLQAEALPPELAHSMMQSLALVSGAVEGELARTGPTSERGNSVEASRVIDRIVAVVSRTPAGQAIDIRSEIAAGLCLPISEVSALEAFGAIIENAVRHALTKVEISGDADANRCWITIADDGPGIPPELRETALQRGRRLDERSGSHGLGLAIAQDFVAASGGALALEDAPGGGLAVRLSWPI